MSDPRGWKITSSPLHTGNTAAIETFGKDGRSTLVFSDEARSPTVLVTFSSDGVGSAAYRNGHPALVVSERSYSVYGTGGDILEHSRWPRKSADPVHLALDRGVKLAFGGRSSITVHVSTNEGVHELSCGAAPRRTLPYNAAGLALGRTPAGKVLVDVDRVRERFASEGHLYGQAGPHSLTTARPGLGSLAQTIRSLAADTPVRGILTELDDVQARVRMINTLPRCLSGTLRKDTRPTLSLDELGSDTLSRSQQRLLKRLEPKPIVYTRKRSKVPLMPQAELSHRVWGPGAPSDVLVVVCCFATFVPASRRALNIMEEAQTILAAKGAVVAAGYGASTRAGGGEDNDALQMVLRPHAQRTVLFNVDLGESNIIQEKYGFRSAPVWFGFFNGRLVGATNDVWESIDLAKLITIWSNKGLKNDYLSAHFSFNYSENQLLDPIISGALSLRR